MGTGSYESREQHDGELLLIGLCLQYLGLAVNRRTEFL